MEDPNHLERMGSELKCPICLSLLSSAVSLSCNHVFCNSCIVKSMKSDSNCPVCKVPYRRREVRPAPHMDSLVSIYKSMEIASGINIFVTQNAPPAKISDGNRQLEDCDNQDGLDCGGIFQERAGEKKASQRNERRDHNPVTNAKGEPVLSPFFWLREEEESVESLSQHDDVDELTNALVPNAPSFSDIKDSDDETHDGLSPQGEVLGKSTSVADLLDSEMFEWTQRSCSPELCSSPFKMEVADTEIGGVHVKELKEASHDKRKGKEVPDANAINMKSKPDNGSTSVLHDISNPGTKTANSQAGNLKSKKRGRKAREATGNTNALDGIDPASEINIDLNNGSIDSSLKLSKICKRRKKSRPCTTAANPKSENVVASSAQGGTFDHGGENMVNELPSLLGKKENNNEDFTWKAGKKSQKTQVQDQIQHAVRSRKQKLDSLDSMQNELGEVSEIQNEMTQGGVPKLSFLSVPTADNGKVVDSRDRRSTRSRRLKSCDHEPRSKKGSTVSSGGNSNSIIVNETRGGQVTHIDDFQAKETHATDTIQDSPDDRDLADPALVKKVPSLTNDVVLQRCKTTLVKKQCAFCLSSEESEAAGEIVHYNNGRPIAADHNGGPKVIHSHKNCTEWAPNVYFKDDIAMNLEAELTRSRKIKCCCCGAKGAALGCYEKSCRKSFHVRCAKLIPNADGILITLLCFAPFMPPLSCQVKIWNFKKGRKDAVPRNNRTFNKIQFQLSITLAPLLNGDFVDHLRNWFSVVQLSQSQRGFEKVAGVTVLKMWDSSVTHVIASTDENRAFRRTLKVLMGILEGKWILSMDWIKACMEANKLVDEERYEINIDTNGIRDGPRLGRLRLLNKQPKLFNGFQFYLMGEFVPSYKGYLQDLIIAAGGTILHRKPVSKDQKTLFSGSPTYQTFIVYSLEPPEKYDRSKQDMIFNRRRVDAEALASSNGAKAASNLCVLNSIAACKLQILTE
ncbi:hypothetical protein FNV43_RR06430 [Rhamnella rubrinervis]|uniref:Uncharacterized protein n=1 Tax=Rhamnella rubrinervis TaxID=2594499 RepID=A0A8K0MLZ2_9ROSA|nr:hypothetical protein FNV43_RR06430 [Rhamnella rubrinervis]